MRRGQKLMDYRLLSRGESLYKFANALIFFLSVRNQSNLSNGMSVFFSRSHKLKQVSEYRHLVSLGEIFSFFSSTFYPSLTHLSTYLLLL